VNIFAVRANPKFQFVGATVSKILFVTSKRGLRWHCNICWGQRKTRQEQTRRYICIERIMLLQNVRPSRSVSKWRNISPLGSPTALILQHSKTIWLGRQIQVKKINLQFYDKLLHLGNGISYTVPDRDTVTMDN